MQSLKRLVAVVVVPVLVVVAANAQDSEWTLVSGVGATLRNGYVIPYAADSGPCCYILVVDHEGDGADPTTYPRQGEGCAIGEYQDGEVVTLTAAPAPGWRVERWSGTDDDTSTQNTNTVTKAPWWEWARVYYTDAPKPCYQLTRSHTGEGTAPTAEPPNSEGCAAGSYHSDEVVTLTAVPDSGWEVEGWTGTDDDPSRDPTNTVTMPAADHEVLVHYAPEGLCFTLTTGHTGMGSDPVAHPLGDGTVWTEHLVDGSFEFANEVFSADIDGDGDMDVLGAASAADDISWWENVDGSGLSWTEHSVDESFDGARAVYAADLDGDGDVDVLGAANQDDDISWWENVDGDGLSWSEHLVDGSLDSAESVYAADIDGDGDLDVLGAAEVADEVTWWENLNGLGTSWSEHLVDTSFDGAFSLRAAEVDGDGDLDIVGAARFGDEVAWWENANGGGTEWTKHTVDGFFDEAWTVDAADVDGDGDVDVLGAAEFADDITWWENVDGAGTVWAEHTVDGSFDGARWVHAADIDRDGDLDVLGAARTADTVTWWENLDGSGTAWAEHLVDGIFDGADSVYAADIDGDGDLDVLGAANQADDITWWENTYTGLCFAGRYQTGDRLGLVANPDPGWGVASWSGTDDDATRDLDNMLTMPAADHLVSVNYTQDPVLAASGDCPGESVFHSSGLTPFGAFAMLVATSPGSSLLDTGACAGTETGLDAPVLVRVATADSEGEDGVTRTTTEGQCGFYMQVVDATTCRPSNVAQVPEELLLTVSGSCPGDVTLTFSGMTPFEVFGLYAAENQGNGALTSGDCAGTAVDLDMPWLLNLYEADAEGGKVDTFPANAGQCGYYLQAVDSVTCRKSNLGQMPQ